MTAPCSEHTHYKRWRNHGTTDRIRNVLTPVERLMAKVQRSEGGCWLWTGSITRAGYGRIRGADAHDGRTVLAHRLAYELLVGPIPQGLHLDHLCRVRRCVNPEHLEPVTLAENNRRAAAAMAAAPKDT